MNLSWVFLATVLESKLRPLDLTKFRPSPIYRRTVPLAPTLVQPIAPRVAADVDKSKETKDAFGPILLAPPRINDLIAPRVSESVPVSIQTQGRSAVALDNRLGKKSIEDTLCDVVCSNTDLNGVLSMLSVTTKANLVAITSSDQKLTLSLKRVRLGDALKHIASVVGMTYLQVGTTFLLGAADRLKEAYPAEWERAHPATVPTTSSSGSTTPAQEPPVLPVEEEVATRTYFCSYVLAEGLKATVKELFGDDLKIAVGPPAITPTLADRDTAGATGVSQGLIDKDGKPIGRAIVLYGKKSKVLEAIEILRNLDQPRSQVAIQVTIHDISDNALRELGVSWAIGGTSFSENDPRGINFGSFTRSPLNFGATIKALETQDKAKILASPNVTVLDGERAFVLIGNKLTLPKFSGYDANKIPMYDTSEYKVGIYLQVAATVSGDGTITLSIYPQVSTVVKTTEINGASYPDIATREAQTSLRVKSGETILLGGLLRTEEMQQMEQVPLLSKIPIFGELFRRRKTTKSSSQVVISLTPTLIAPTHEPR